MNRKLIVASLTAACVALTLAACGTTAPEPRVVTQTVRVPVPVPCATRPGPDPAYVDTDDAIRSAPGLFERVKLLLAGREQRQAREAELKAANAACAGP